MVITTADRVRTFFETCIKSPILQFIRLPQSGGDRLYFRILCKDKSYIVTYNDNVRETETFIAFSNKLKSANAPVPEVYFKDEESHIYIQEDFGSTSLLNEIEKHGKGDHVFNLYKKSLSALAALQVKGDSVIDYSYCLTAKEFGKQAIMSDLLYFKYYFLDTLKIPYDKEQLLDDFQALATYLTHVEHKFFMFRDFQSRNIYITDGRVHFIDFQGGMKGAPHYDVASLLWQARTSLPQEWKDSLLEHYIGSLSEVLGQEIERPQFRSQYYGYVLIRLLQVLGAYGFRGLFERKAQFLTSIPLALENLKWFRTHYSVGISTPEFVKLLDRIILDDIVDRFRPISADQNTPLVVKINSFSYKKGIPTDASGNGGGFVFDCRGILNPGRLDEFKTLTGRDKPVKDFLERRTKMPEFLNGVYNAVDVSVEDYIKRGFSSLIVSFGCTGGQHRSVYAADALRRYLRNKYKVKIELHHIEQHIFEKSGFEE